MAPKLEARNKRKEEEGGTLGEEEQEEEEGEKVKRTKARKTRRLWRRKRTPWSSRTKTVDAPERQHRVPNQNCTDLAMAWVTSMLRWPPRPVAALWAGPTLLRQVSTAMPPPTRTTTWEDRTVALRRQAVLCLYRRFLRRAQHLFDPIVREYVEGEVKRRFRRYRDAPFPYKANERFKVGRKVRWWRDCTPS